MMTDTKPWYLSRTVWAALVTVALAGAELFKAPVAGVDQGALVDALLQGAAAVAGLVALIGRVTARQRIE